MTTISIVLQHEPGPVDAADITSRWTGATVVGHVVRLPGAASGRRVQGFLINISDTGVEVAFNGQNVQLVVDEEMGCVVHNLSSPAARRIYFELPQQAEVARVLAEPILQRDRMDSLIVVPWMGGVIVVSADSDSIQLLELIARVRKLRFKESHEIPAKQTA